MRRIVLMLATIFSMCCLVACGGETQGDLATGNKEEVVMGDVANEPTAKPVVEATAEPTVEPSSKVAEATAEPTPTEEPSVVYEGIDMESDLPGEEWVETFVGIIEEPKIIVFSDETGRREIFEKDSVIKFNPDTDIIGLYFPEGYTCKSDLLGVGNIKKGHLEDYFFYLEFNPEETRNDGPQMSAFYLEYNGEEIEFTFVTVPE